MRKFRDLCVSEGWLKYECQKFQVNTPCSSPEMKIIPPWCIALMLVYAVLITSLGHIVKLIKNPGLATTLEERESAYTRINVLEDKDTRWLSFSNQPTYQSLMYRSPDRRDTLAAPYVLALAKRIESASPWQKILIIGLGGGSLPRYLRQKYPKAQITVSEIDPAVVEVAKEYFYFEPQNFELKLEDVRVTLKSAATIKYDIIVLDAYTNAHAPPHLCTVEFFQQTRDHLAPEGILLVNVSKPTPQFKTYLSNTLACVFGDVYFSSVINSYNNIAIASGVSHEVHHPHLSDDFSPIHHLLQP